MNALLATLTSLLILVLAAAFAAPYVVDWNQYRSVFEAQASKLAGRAVRVEGDVDLTILPVPEVRFERVSIADRTGSFDTPSATADAFRLALSIPPLLRGQIEARKLELDRLSLRLGLDENGQVRWPRIGEAAGALPFITSDVALKSVTLNEASLAVSRPGETARWRIQGVSGELSAETLRGPFKFAGQAMIGDELRDLQFSAGTMTPEGMMPVKAASPGETVVYRAEGNLRELADGPEFVGTVEASAPLPPQSGGQPPEWRAAGAGRATLDSANFEDFSVTITREQRPQTLSGTARFTWDGGLRLEAELRSQWLDLDLLAGSQVSERMPAEVLLELPALLANVPVPAERARIDITVAQASLGGDLIRDIHAVAQRSDGGWGVEKLEAGLPAGADFGFEGRFARRGGAPVLAGMVRASGGNLARLLQWAAPGMLDERDASAKAFSLSGQVESASDAFSISDISARLGETRFGGAVRLALDEAAATVDLNARTLDLRPYLSGGTAEMLARFTARGGLSALDAQTWQVALRADRLILPEFTATDVESRLQVDGNAITAERVALRGDDGLHVSASGRYPLGDSQTAPALRASLAADDAQRIMELASVVPGAQARLAPHMARLRTATPLNLVADLRASEVENGYLLRIDGTAAQTALLATARIYAGQRVHLALSADNPTLRGLARQLAPDLTAWLGMEQAPGLAQLRADFTGAFGALGVGEPAVGDQRVGEPWTGVAEIATDTLRFAFDGSAQPGMLQFNGDVTIDAPRAADALALAGLRADENGPLDVRAAVSSRDNIYSARDLRFNLAGRTTTGNVRVDVSAATPRVEANLNAERFDLASAAGLLVEQRGSREDAFWPDTPFAVETLRRLSGSLSLAADELTIADGLSLNEATVMARLQDGAVQMPTLSGLLYGGEAVGSAELRPARGRTVFDGEIAVTALDLAQLPHGEGAPLAAGRADMSLRVRSEGLSPRGLMTVMTGTGQVRLSAGEIRGLDPQVLAREAQAYLAADAQPDETVTATLATPLRESRFAHDGAQATLQIKDGALRIPRTQLVAGTDGLAVETDARLDLSEMTLTSRWDLGAALGGEALPAVRVSFAGPVADFGALQPRIDADNLEQFLTVARVERNVERLEELRRQRDADLRPARESAPEPGGSSASAQEATMPPPDDTDLGDTPLETLDPLPGFSTQIEETPPSVDAPTAGAQAAEAASEPASASAVPGAPLDDPQVVEDARREIMRNTPPRQPRQPQSDRFFEIFQN